MRCGFNTTVDALLKHERTMHLFRFSGICQKYLIVLKCWDVISITYILYFSISPLLGLKTKPPKLTYELSSKWNITFNVLLAGKIVTVANWYNLYHYRCIFFIRICLCSFYLPLLHSIVEKEVFISCIFFCQPEVSFWYSGSIGRF